MKLRLYGSLVISLCVPLSGQVSGELEQLDRQIASKQSDLEKLRDEINLYQRRITKKEQAEQNELQQLYDVEENISLTSRLIKALTDEINQLSDGINLAQVLIKREETEITNLQDKLAERFVHIYRQRRASMLELILTSRNWNQATYRAKYLKVAVDYDRYLTKQVKEEIARLERHRTKLSKDRSLKQSLLSEKGREEKRLLADKRKRKQQIERIKRDRRNDERVLTEKQKAAVEIERLIAGLEKDRDSRSRALSEIRRRREMDDTPDVTFYRGKLPWPTTGQIVARFGQQRNPRLNTITENTGIDIRSAQGSDVSSVLDGLVTTITYLRGFGTTIIIDHGKDLYTVYTHVEEVLASEGEYVDQGQIIALVGSTGSLDGAKLHFEVWTNRQKQDPELWLAKPISF